MSPTLTPSHLQSFIISRLSQLRKRQGNSKKLYTQKAIFFLDDLHMTSPFLAANAMTRNNAKEALFMHCPIPVMELVKDMLENGQLHDTSRNYQHSLSSVQLLASSTPNGIHRLPVKLLRQFRVVPFFPLSADGLCKIVQHKLFPWLQTFPLESVENTKTLSWVSNDRYYTIDLMLRQWLLQASQSSRTWLPNFGHLPPTLITASTFIVCLLCGVDLS